MSYSLFRIKKIWHFRFQVDGKRTQHSTRESARQRAEEVAQKAYDNAKLWARGESPVPTLNELIDQWATVHEKTVSASHLKSVETFRRLHTYQLGALPLTAIDTSAVEAARNQHLESHAAASANHWVRILKLVMNWAVNRKVIPLLPWRVKMLKLQRRPRVMLPAASAKAWLAAIDRVTATTPSIATCIRLMLGLGLREMEAAGARWEWIDWERKRYTPGVTKGREAEPVPMPDWLIDHLQPKRKAFGVIAPARVGEDGLGEGYSRGFATRAMRAANGECGIRGLTPHRLRGTFATLLSEAGVPVQDIQRIMRHKSALTTMGYLEVNLAASEKGQARIAEKLGFSGEQTRNDTALSHAL